ncbi:MAG TPA: holdfast anchoring protein HfaA [Caulobacteraceae bacterium]
MSLISHRAAARLALVALAALGFCGAADAQSINTNSAAYNAGYGRYAGQENQPVDVGIRDANGNLVIVDGLIQTGEIGAYAQAQAGGAIDTFAGVGASGSSTAIGNNLNVVTQGNDNTVIVSSSQTNTGNVSASTH